ncbi:hypothetical protein ACOME3_009188 [Neoechinorhynchus agilis]
MLLINEIGINHGLIVLCVLMFNVRDRDTHQDKLRMMLQLIVDNRQTTNHSDLTDILLTSAVLLYKHYFKDDLNLFSKLIPVLSVSDATFHDIAQIDKKESKIMENVTSSGEMANLSASWLSKLATYLINEHPSELWIQPFCFIQTSLSSRSRRCTPPMNNTLMMVDNVKNEFDGDDKFAIFDNRFNAHSKSLLVLIGKLIEDMRPIIGDLSALVIQNNLKIL